MASRLGRRRATQFQSRWVAEYPARAQRLAVMVQRLVREPPSGRGAVRTLFGGWTVALLTEADLGVRGIFMRRALRHWRAAAAGLPPGLWQLCDVARLRAELETRTAALERQARCYELDVAAAKATLLLVSHRVHEPRLRAELAERCERLPSFDPRPLLGDVAGAARREAFGLRAACERHGRRGDALEVSRDCELVARPCAACRGVLTASWRRSKHVEDALISEERHRHTEDALSTALYRLDALRDEARALWKRCETAEDARAPLEAHAAKRNEEVRTLRRDAFKAQERYRARRRPRRPQGRPRGGARADGLAARNGDLQLELAACEQSLKQADARGLDAAVRLQALERAEADAASRWRAATRARAAASAVAGGAAAAARARATRPTAPRGAAAAASGASRRGAACASPPPLGFVARLRSPRARARARRGRAERGRRRGAPGARRRAAPRRPRAPGRGGRHGRARAAAANGGTRWEAEVRVVEIVREADADAARAAAAAELEATDRALAKTKRTLAARERELKDCKQETKRACHLADRSRDELAQVRVVHKQGVKAAREEERAVADRLASSYAHKVEGLWWLVGVQRRRRDAKRELAAAKRDAAEAREAAARAAEALEERDAAAEAAAAAAAKDLAAARTKIAQQRSVVNDCARQIDRMKAKAEKLAADLEAAGLRKAAADATASAALRAPDITSAIWHARQAFSPVTPAPPGDRFAEALRDVGGRRREDGKGLARGRRGQKELAEDRRAKRLAAAAIPTQTERPRAERACQTRDPTKRRTVNTQTPAVAKAHWVGAPLGVWTPQHDEPSDDEKPPPRGDPKTAAAGPRALGRVPVKRPGLRSRETPTQTPPDPAAPSRFDLLAEVARLGPRSPRARGDAATQVTTARGGRRRRRRARRRPGPPRGAGAAADVRRRRAAPAGRARVGHAQPR
ncbi:hypothetical protein JL722_8722 [Aureococcus anophagefferens]|nr:hypothetical protein JL722_8722 [Aureococcus anophagefferens]